MTTMKELKPMPGIWDFEDDQPQGLFGNLQRSFANPMTLSGMALLSGEGWGGAARGMQMGQGFEQQRMASQQQRTYQDLISRPEMRANLPPGFSDLLAAAGPERGFPLLAKFADPDRGLDLETQRAILAKTKAETNALSQKDQMTNFVLGLLGGEEGGGQPSAPAPGVQSPPTLQPQSAPPMQPSGPMLQDASLPSLWDQGGSAGSPVSQPVVSHEPRQEPPAWFQHAQFAQTQAQNAQPQLQEDQGSAAAGPQSGQVYSMPGSEIVNTPLGKMTRDRARRLGLGFAMSGKGDAGRMMIDAATGGADLAKPTVNALQERTLNSASHLARLSDIDKKFNPQWLEIPKRIEMLGASWSAKAGEMLGGKLTAEKTQELRAYAQFRSASVNNLNTILKEMSGAAVTPQEYERIQNDQPVAGTGIFDGDDPVSFKAKADRSKATLKAAIARYNFMRSKGLNFDRNSLDQFMALDDVPAAIDQRGAEIERQILDKTPNVDRSALQDRVGKQLKREFGI